MAEPITTAQAALNLVADYYKTTVPEITRVLNQYGADTTSVKDILAILIDDGATAYDLIYNADGSLRNIVYDNVTDYLNSGASSALNAMHQINSNTTATAVAEKTKLSGPIQAALAEAGVTFTAGATAVKTGLTTTTVVNPVSAGIAGVGAGIALGIGIDGLLYSANPDFWDAHSLSTLNPETWKTIVDGNDMFTGLFKTDATAGTSQMYLDENALAYFAKYLNGKGAFDSESVLVEQTVNGHTIPQGIYRQTGIFNTRKSTTDSEWVDGVVCIRKGEPIHVSSFVENANAYSTIVTDGKYTYLIVATDNQNVDQFVLRMPNGESLAFLGAISFTYNNKTVRYQTMDAENYTALGEIITIEPGMLSSMAWALVYGTYTNAGGVAGIDIHPDGKTPNISTTDTVDAVLEKLKEQYPSLWDDALTVSTPQPDGTFKTYTYVPVGSAVANGRLDTQPTNTTQTQTNTAVNVNTSPQELVDTIIQTTTSKPTKTDVNTGTNTGSGGTPVVPPVTGKASALYTIYNPTLEQINSLGAWLWSSNFIDQLLKLFSSPMDAIIGLHKIYATPATGAAQNIKVGYLDSGVPSNVVTEQYTTIDCGTINCYEYFGNVLDYNPYTNLRLYLPFIGIIELSNSDVMRSNINVVYHVDVLTGACLAEVKITRDGGGGTLYQYAGNACTTLPISSGSYMGVISSVSSVATRALAGFASGGALGAVASGATGMLNAQGTNVVHSGGFSGNAGAMGCKKPYLIIERPQTETADNTAKLLGYGSNIFVQLKTCKGLTRVKCVHVDAVPATKDEKKLIEDKLMDGVIIS